MQILVNGTPHEVSDAVSVAALLEGLQLQEQRLAIELNGMILPRSHWRAQCLSRGDRVEIVRAIGGG